MRSTKEMRIEFVRASIEFTFCSIKRRYIRLCELLQKYSVHNEDDEIIATAWDIVDWSERLRGLLSHATGIPSNDPWLNWFRRELEPIEKMRHIIQHLRGSLEACLEDKTALFGTVSAYCSNAEQTAYDIVVAVASPFRSQEVANNSEYLETEINFHPPVDQVRLRVGRHRINLTNFINLINDGHNKFVERIQQHPVR